MRRVRFATIAVFGLGLFVAVAVGVTLYLSGAAGVRSTQALLAQQAEAQLAASGGERNGSSWRAPIRGRISGAAVLLHDNPLRRDGRYLGMLVQVVPVAALSREFVVASSEAGITPFILYGGDRVLAHPQL